MKISAIGRVCDGAIESLRAEFGAVLAQRIIESEALDFLWEARVRERYLGQQIGFGFDDEAGSQELSRVAILSALESRWYLGMCLVDGEGVAVELLWKRPLECWQEAEMELLRAR
ncbi:MAG TPA: hypothetical protein VF582_09270 [Allosphingosinicella sp.]|jgi:hypothetical protein